MLEQRGEILWRAGRREAAREEKANDAVATKALQDEVQRLNRELTNARKAFELQAMHFALPKEDHRRKSIITLDKPDHEADLIPKVAALEDATPFLSKSRLLLRQSALRCSFLQ